MIVVDTGPLVSLMNAAEGDRHLLARLLDDVRLDPVVPWPVLLEADLFLRGKGRSAQANAMCQVMATGRLRLETPTHRELTLALTLLERYGSIGLDLPDAVVIAMSDTRAATAFTWDFRHFRAVVVNRGVPLPLLVQESDLA